jgi:hypothetical protein
MNVQKDLKVCVSNLPAQGTQDEVHNEKCSDENEGNKINPRPWVTQGVIHLECLRKKGTKNQTKSNEK